MLYEELESQIANHNSKNYPKQLIYDNLQIINKYFNIDLSCLSIGRIGRIIKEKLNPKCSCGKLKTWNRVRISNTCGDKECVTIHIKEKFISKYGVDCAQKIPEIKKKTKETNMRLFGKESYLSTSAFQIKSQETCMIKYNVSNFSKSSFRNKNIAIQRGIKNIENLNRDFIIQNFINLNNNIKVDEFMEYFEYKGSSSVYYLFKKLDINYNKMLNRSKYEDQIIDYIKTITQNEIIISNDRSIISPSEIDIYLSNYNIGIEFNGLYWHSYGLEENNTSNKQYDKIFQQKRHLEKTNLFEKLSDSHQLFHIFENEWIDSKKQDIWKSIISNKLGLNTKKIFARKCIIKEISAIEANIFILNNHIQGIRNAKIKLGLYYNNELVSVMTLGKPLDTKSKYEYELIRFCNKKYTNIIGGASKLLKYFERKYRPKSLISYANRRWSKGNLYNNLGFELSNISSPNKFIIKNDKLKSRLQYQKHKLENKLEIYDEKLSADDNIINNNLRIIWDSGNYSFIKNY